MRPSRARILCLLLAILPALVFGQYSRQRRRGSPGPNNGAPGGASPEVDIHGVLRSINKKDIVIDTGDDQILTFKRTKKTRFLKGASEIKPDDFPDAAKVTIEASRAMNGDLDAINVFLGEPP